METEDILFVKEIQSTVRVHKNIPLESESTSYSPYWLGSSTLWARSTRVIRSRQVVLSVIKTLRELDIVPFCKTGGVIILLYMCEFIGIKLIHYNLKLKADRQHLRCYPYMPPDYRYTDKHLRLVMTHIALRTTITSILITLVML